MNDLIEHAQNMIASGRLRDAVAAITEAIERAIDEQDAETLDRARALLRELDASAPISLTGSYVRHRVARLGAFADHHARELRSRQRAGVASRGADAPEQGPVGAGLGARVEEFEKRMGALQVELAELKRLAAVGRRPTPAAPRVSDVVPVVPPAPFEWETGTGVGGRLAAAAGRAKRTSDSYRPRLHLSPVSLDGLLSARSLAWAGAVVTLLGIALLFALAVERRVLGPEERLGLGAALSAGLAGVSLLARRRWGSEIGSLACFGTGLAGAYATLAASAALYDLLPFELALGIAAVIGGVATAASLAWRAPVIAGLGLLGALVVTPVVAHGATVAGGAFLAVVFACSAAVAIARGWRWLLAAAAAVTALQVVAAVGGAAPTWQRLTLAAVFWLAYVAGAVALQLRRGAALDPLTAPLVLGGLALASGAAAVTLVAGDRVGVALVVPAVVHLAAGAALRRLESQRALAGLLGASGLAVAAVAAGTLLDGFALALAWSAQAVVLGWLAARTGEIRLRLASFAYLALALGAALVESPPLLLFTEGRDWAAGSLSPLAASAAAFLVARLCCPTADRDGRGAVARLEAAAARWNTWIGSALLVAAGLLATEAASLAVLAAAPGFSAGHLVLTGAYALVGTTALAVAAGRRSVRFADAGTAWLGLVAVKAIVFDLPQLAPPFAALGLVAIGVAALVAAHLRQTLAGRDLTAASGLLLAGGAVLLALAGFELVEGRWHGLDALGLSYVGLAAALGGSAAVAWRRSDKLATLSWALGSAAAVVGLALVADAWVLTVAWVALASGLGLCARRTDDRALGDGALAVAALAAIETLVVQAAPDSLFVASGDPAAGVVSVLVAAAGLAGASQLGARTTSRRRASERRIVGWASGGLALYGCSLGILGAWVASGGDTTADFQTGQVAVSAFWATAGLVLLAAGLARQARGLRLGGFALFGAALGKIFLYDLAALSAATRAFSFLAVGVLLLIAGVAYQRLVDRSRDGRTA